MRKNEQELFLKNTTKIRLPRPEEESEYLDRRNLGPSHQYKIRIQRYLKPDEDLRRRILIFEEENEEEQYDESYFPDDSFSEEEADDDDEIKYKIRIPGVQQFEENISYCRYNLIERKNSEPEGIYKLRIKQRDDAALGILEDTQINDRSRIEDIASNNNDNSNVTIPIERRANSIFNFEIGDAVPVSILNGIGDINRIINLEDDFNLLNVNPGRISFIANNAGTVQNPEIGQENRSEEFIVRPVRGDNYCFTRFVPVYNLGDMNKKCKYCKAKHFSEEREVEGAYKDCCGFGKIKFPERRAYPEYLKSLLIDESFKRNIRNYNSSLSFASMGCGNVVAPGRGPYCYVLQGQVYHTVYNIESRSGREKKFSQLYAIDTTEASETRAANVNNRGCDQVILTNLDRLIREINPYAGLYYNMGEVVRQARANNRLLENVTMVFNRNISRSTNRWNMPTANEIAMIFTDPNGEPPFQRDLKVYARHPDFDAVSLNILSPHLDPMQYVLFYPNGEPGWQVGLRLPNYINDHLNIVSMASFKIAQLAVRKREFNPLLFGGNLLQQWVVDAYIQVESNRLNFIRANQEVLRAEDYNGMVDYVTGHLVENGERPVILPATFQGGNRNMRERYFDSMSIVTKFGKPDLFITMTCNPNWAEIKENLFIGQSASDRPDLVAKVFCLKLKKLIDDIVKKRIFGIVTAFVYTIEFQKRGLPHAHMLFILEEKFDVPEKIDRVVSAEIPDPGINLNLNKKVLKHMVHGPCGINFPRAPCMEDGLCKKKFPKSFEDRTRITNGYPAYKRTSNGSYTYKNTMITNSHVVPYNSYLLQRYDCHINVEVCTSIRAIKYIFKYIHKNYDCANMNMHMANEINQYVTSRYIGAPEGMWRLYKYSLHDRSHTVIRLPVHLPRDRNLENYGEAEENVHRSKLLAWFDLNVQDREARKYYYSEIPLYYIFERDKWVRRSNRTNRTISRLYAVVPRDRERYYLRMLLLEVKGATSFSHLKKYNNIEYPTFEAAAAARGLIISDDSSIHVMAEAARTQMPSRIRLLFALLCIGNMALNPLGLFNRFLGVMSEDCEYDKQDFVLCYLESIFIRNGRSLRTFGLPQPRVQIDHMNVNRAAVDINEHTSNIRSLNRGQLEAFEIIKETVQTRGGLIFLDGPAGTGKTFLYKVLIAEMKLQNKGVVITATTGIAADLIGNGRTVHSAFNLPTPLIETSTSRIVLGSPHAERIRTSSLILVDEVSMLSKYGLECIDELLRRVCNTNEPFGGKTVLLGGDFRQTANVLPRGTRADILETSIKSSNLWEMVQILNLTENMRCEGNIRFAEWLLAVGEGTINNVDEQVEIAKRMQVAGDLVDEIYGEGILNTVDVNLCNKIILVSINEHATELNLKVIAKINGQEKNYISADRIVTTDQGDFNDYPQEFLYSQQPSGMPPHVLKLKIGVIVMLIRNIEPTLGLLNGTRLIIRELHDNFVLAEILTGVNSGFIVLIPKMDLEPSDTTLPFRLNRFQLPIVPAFAITIHKSQGQTFEKVGVYLPENVFTHGQLYVALSRVKSEEGLKIKMPDRSLGKLSNIVYRELL